MFELTFGWAIVSTVGSKQNHQPSISSEYVWISFAGGRRWSHGTYFVANEPALGVVFCLKEWVNHGDVSCIFEESLKCDSSCDENGVVNGYGTLDDTN